MLRNTMFDHLYVYMASVFILHVFLYGRMFMVFFCINILAVNHRVKYRTFTLKVCRYVQVCPLMGPLKL